MEATANYTAPSAVASYRGRALVVGLVFTVIGVVLAYALGSAAGYGGLVHVFRSYLVGFVFCTGLSVGSLAWLSLGHMTGGAWALTSRRLFEAATRTLPLCALMFVPVVVSLFVHEHGHSLYEWSDPAVVAGDPSLQHKKIYLNPLFFIVRTVIYFAVWFFFAWKLNRWSAEQDSTADPRIRRKMQDISGPVILLFGLTVTFAAVDWGMSLEPHWFSTIYGLIIMAGWGLAALAFMIMVASFLSRREPMAEAYNSVHFHDWGKLLLALVMLYAYFAFSQFLIIWAGNLPEEIPFYLRRLRGGWEYAGLAVVMFHFALPFVLLLSRPRKQRAISLRKVAALMLFMRVFDLVFFFAPSVHQGGEAAFGWRDLVTSFVPMFAMAIGLGGIWLWYYFGQLASRPLLPLGAPDLDKALAASEHH
ncbi:MAG TPA: hypothetical protein VGP08_21980 [Pyrinomonadaceae bacterium]|jgi:hypothetical protein|nr:hypothetical protein [Pyrinomonadaceae bacterium]